MPRTKKDYHTLNIRMASETYEALEKFCEETGITKTTATEKILNRFFGEYFKKEKEDRDLFNHM